MVSGNVKPLREKLLLLLSVYGSKVAADAHAVSSGVVSGVRRAATVVSKELVPIARVVGVNGYRSGFESDEEDDMKGRIPAQDKWGQFDDDCNVASSCTFNGK